MTVLSTKIPLDQNTSISMRNNAGILVVGRPGTGKTILATYLMLMTMKIMKAKVYVIDNKRSDFSNLAGYLINGNSRVATTANQTAGLLRRLNDNMNSRYTHHHDHYGYDWMNYNLRPSLIIMDEVAATMSEAANGGTKLKNEIQNYTRSIILRGRQAGIFMLMASQRLSADILDRDQTLQLSTRIVMGQADRDTYRMAFPTADYDSLPFVANQPGNGLILADEMNTNVPQPFQAPSLEKIDVPRITMKLDNQAQEFQFANEDYWQD